FWPREVRGAEVATTGVHILGAVTARAVAIEAADRDVIGGRRDRGDVEERRVHRRAVTGQAPGHTLVRAGGRVEPVVARGRVALRARRTGRNVLRGQGGARVVGDNVMARGATAAPGVTRVKALAD